MCEQTFKIFFSSYDVCAEEELLLRRIHNYASKNTYLAQTSSPVEEVFCSLPRVFNVAAAFAFNITRLPKVHVLSH